MTRDPSDSGAHLVEPAVITGVEPAHVHGVAGDLRRLAPGTVTRTPANDLGTLIALIPADALARRILAALAVSWNGIVVALGTPVSFADAATAERELAELASVARRVCSRGCAINADDLLPYRSLASAPRAELQLIVDRTVGGVLGTPLNERSKLLETLWARHRHDTESAAVRNLGIDPKTMRRRRERIKELTGLDPSRQRDRFRLDVGLHALHLLDSARTNGSSSLRAVPYPKESRNPGVRPNLAIAPQRHGNSSSAPDSPQPTANRAGREEHTT